MNKPIIGIVSKHYATYKSNKIDTFVRDEIKQAIFDNGGIAIGILPTESGINYCGDEWKDNLSIEEKENLIAQIKLCNGIILQGGINYSTYEVNLARYLIDLAKAYSSFYNENKIIVENKDVQNARVYLTYATSEVLKQGANLLGIEMPEKM